MSIKRHGLITTTPNVLPFRNAPEGGWVSRPGKSKIGDVVFLVVVRWILRRPMVHEIGVNHCLRVFPFMFWRPRQSAAQYIDKDCRRCSPAIDSGAKRICKIRFAPRSRPSTIGWTLETERHSLLPGAGIGTRLQTKQRQSSIPYRCFAQSCRPRLYYVILDISQSPEGRCEISTSAMPREGGAALPRTTHAVCRGCPDNSPDSAQLSALRAHISHGGVKYAG